MSPTGLHARVTRVGAVLFDCDGTLVDSEELSLRAVIVEAGRHGLSPEEGETLARFRGGVLADCVAEVESLLGQRLPDDFTARVRATMAQLFERELKPMPHAAEIVRALRVPCAVASNGPLEKMRQSLSLTGMLSLFEGRLFSSYTIQRWKPAPDLFLHAAAELGVPPAHCVVVEDSRPGVLAGLSAGMRVFALQEASAGLDDPSVLPISSLLDLRRHLPDDVWVSE